MQVQKRLSPKKLKKKYDFSYEDLRVSVIEKVTVIEKVPVIQKDKPGLPAIQNSSYNRKRYTNTIFNGVAFFLKNNPTNNDTQK